MDLTSAEKEKLMISVLNDKCDLCGCCVGVCPADALELTKLELKILPLRCTNCAKCVWSCPLEALVFNSDGVMV